MNGKTRRTAVLAATLVLLLTCAASVRAAENPISWSTAGIPRKALPSGAKFSVKLIARIDAGWHLYAQQQEEGGPIPTEISLADQPVFTLGSVRASKPIELLDPNFNKRVGLYIETAEFSLPLTVVSGAPEGSQHAPIQVRYQCCNETMCLPPRTAIVDLAVSIKAQR